MAAISDRFLVQPGSCTLMYMALNVVLVKMTKTVREPVDLMKGISDCVTPTGFLLFRHTVGAFLRSSH